jgi:hypothetical protein
MTPTMLRFVRYVLFALVTGCMSSAVRADDPEFGRHVAPILYKLGCSAGACHGSFAGKGGFRLSLFAGHAETDYQNIRAALGRRINPVTPEKSLLLLKPTAAIEHGGGVRLKADSLEYQILKKWIASGAKYDPQTEPRVVSVRVDPATMTISANAKPQATRVIAKLSNGKEDTITALTRFESLDPSIASVTADGLVTGARRGDVAVLAHYAGQIGFTTVLVPGTSAANLKFPDEELRDPVDRMLTARLKQLHIVPSPRCDDLEFLRRVYLDVIGQLPEPDQARKFLADPAADKRARVIDELLQHPLHAALWAGKMCDIIGADDRFLGDGVYQFHDWFRNKFEQNLPWDKLALGVVASTAADGREPQKIQEDIKREAAERKLKKPLEPGVKPWQVGYATRNSLDVFYNNLINRQDTADKKRIIDSKKIALRVAHTFLGVRLECAQCHKHPHDRWSQNDFFSFAAAFSYVDYGVDPELKAKKVNLQGTHFAQRPAESFTDPDTGEPIVPRVLGNSTKLDVQPGADPRLHVWKWMTAADNPYFATALVNRVWEHYFGRGLIDPADALSAANPPSHPEALDELVKDFIKHNYDLRHLQRRLLNTVAYQRSYKTNESNAKDERNYSHRLLRRLTAEQALDAIAQVTGTPIKLPKRYGSFREGVRAVEIAISRVGGDDGYVLQIFGKPLRTQNCDCERSSAASLSQTLYLYNDEKLIGKINDPKGRLQKLVSEFKDDRKLLDELYLWTLTRLPTPAEVDRSLAHVRDAGNRLEGYQDVLWSLMNRHEFLVNH